MYNLFVDNFLSNLECEELINRGLKSELNQMTSSKIVNGAVVVQETINEYTNKRKGSYFVNEFLDEPIFKNLTNKLLPLINEKKIFNGIEYSFIPKYTFNQYSEGDFLDWHKDSHEVLYGATLTIIIQLNDEYDGGDVMYSINEEVFSLPKKKGSIFLFDSNINHSVSTINGGVRYSMNAWPGKTIKKVLI